MQITKIAKQTLIILGFLAIPNSVDAKPFELDTYEKNYQKMEIGLTFAKLNQLTTKCLYDKAWLDMDVNLKSGVSTRQGGYTESQDTFAGFVVTVPLYSGKEIDREREKIMERRRQASEDIALMIENIEKVLHNRRMIEIYKIMEVRSKKRVQEGVMSLTEQVEIMEKLSTLRKETITFKAVVGGKYNTLLNSCKPGKDKNYLKDYMDEELEKLKMNF